MLIAGSKDKDFQKPHRTDIVFSEYKGNTFVNFSQLRNRISPATLESMHVSLQIYNNPPSPKPTLTFILITSLSLFYNFIIQVYIRTHYSLDMIILCIFNILLRVFSNTQKS